VRTVPLTLVVGVMLVAGCVPKSPPAPAAPDAALRGIAWPADSSAIAERMAHRLGFETLYESGNLWRVTSRLHHAALIWYPTGHDSSFGAHSDGGLLPLFEGLPRRGEVGGLPIGVWDEREADPMPHANSVVGLVGATAQVPDLDRACRDLASLGLSFGASMDTPDGRARSAALPNGGWVRLVVAPRAAGGAHATPRWVGVTLSVKSFPSARSVLDSTGVRAKGDEAGIRIVLERGEWIELVRYEHAPLTARALTPGRSVR
jgi:hypothetical protein